MPIYVYAEVFDDGTEGEPFEVLQQLSEKPLTVHPETGRKVKKLLTSPAPLLKGPNKLSNDSLAKNGFSKYTRGRNGTYNKQCGPGPNSFKA